MMPPDKTKAQPKPKGKGDLKLKGYLDCRARGVASDRCWQKRFYVLYGPSESNEARLDWYVTEEDFRQQNGARKTIYCEEIEYAVPCKMDNRHAFQLHLSASDKPNIFAATSDAGMKMWLEAFTSVMTQQRRRSSGTSDSSVTKPQTSPTQSSPEYVNTSDESVFSDNILYEALEPPVIYDVEAGDNEAIRRCKLVGSYKLQITSVNLTLCSADGKTAIFVWPYKFIRRYGRNATSFTFEAGRKCPSSEGLFAFKTPIGEEIFDKIQQKIQERKASMEHVESEQPVPVTTVTTPTGSGPSVAARRKQLEGLGSSGDEPPGPPRLKRISKPPNVKEPPYSVPKKEKDQLNIRVSGGDPKTNPKQPLSPKNSNELRNRTQKLVQVPSAPTQDFDEVDGPAGEDCVDGPGGEDCVDGEPDYYLYDIAASAHGMGDYSDPCPIARPPDDDDDYEEHMYAEPEEWADKGDEPPKMSQLVAQMNKMKFRNKVQGSGGEYDHVEVVQGRARAKIPPSDLEHTYGELSSVATPKTNPKPKTKPKPQSTPESDPGYDVVRYPRRK